MNARPVHPPLQLRNPPIHTFRRWIKNMESEAGIETCKPSDKEFLRTLENAVRFGKPVIMENVLSALDPALEPVPL